MSSAPADIERLRRALRDEVLDDPERGVTLSRSLLHGHIAPVLGTAQNWSRSCARNRTGAAAHGGASVGDDNPSFRDGNRASC